MNFIMALLQKSVVVKVKSTVDHYLANITIENLEITRSAKLNFNMIISKLSHSHGPPGL